MKRNSSDNTRTKMTAKIHPATHYIDHPSHGRNPAATSFTLLDQVLDSVTCCSSAENTPHPAAQFDIRHQHHQDENDHAAAAPPPRGELILPHLRFRPLPPLPGYDNDEPSSSSLHDFFRLFLADDAPHSFLTFHQRNGDVDVRIGPWRNAALPSDDAGYHRSLSEPPTRVSSSSSSLLFCGDKRMQRTISFVTRIAPHSSSALGDSFGSSGGGAVVPIGVTNTQTLVMEGSGCCVLESTIQFDLESSSIHGGGRALAGLSQLLISNDVRGSLVNVRVVLREGDRATSVVRHGENAVTGVRSDTRQRSASRGVTLLESCREEETENDSISSFFSCFSHPLLFPPDSLCGSSQQSPKPKETWIKPSISFVDIHGEKQDLQEERKNPAHVGASLLSAIKAKNSDDKEPKPNWTVSEKVFNNRFDDIVATTPGQLDTDLPEYQDDVLGCSSCGSLKLKHIASFEFARAPSSSNASEGHMAMRRMILEKEGVMTSSSLGKSPSFRRSASANSISSTGSHAWRGLSMRIEMDIQPPSASSQSVTSSLSTFSRSKGSFTNIDLKVRKGLKKRVSRTWISWAESWCMRIWEEEENLRNNRRPTGNVDGSSRKRKTNVRPTVRRIGEKREGSASPQSTSSDWNTMQSDKSHGKERWMFVGETSEALHEEEEFGVEVAYTLNAPKVPRRTSVESSNEKDDDEPAVHQLPPEGKEKTKRGRRNSLLRPSEESTVSATASKSRWSITPQVKSKRGAGAGRP
ncbi:hypothetical protein HJC23_012720 [Cyclotella cryptica]|uniref:Uncharacterized protein n=1 Tax=Cyclotella cryptica TaxID=29204 RepID=A0ABD3NUQ4_9STRA|eukprot:CCRYP_019646-RA/>CCRYP_019646-RA protein AED:0.22 eAED:0.22 QI:0/-1/0/1/-1/1/1/0/749